MSEKITAKHLQRKAVLYIRQSSPYQVVHHTEGRRLQYTMKERLEQLGWKEIEILDEDLGYTASGVETRAGFERMVVEVSGLRFCAQLIKLENLWTLTWHLDWQTPAEGMAEPTIIRPEVQK